MFGVGEGEEAKLLSSDLRRYIVGVTGLDVASSEHERFSHKNNFRRSRPVQFTLFIKPILNSAIIRYEQRKPLSPD